MSQKVVAVGTTPVLVAQGNANRAGLVISMPPTAVVSGNTGVVYIGKGFVPVATPGAPNSGDPLSQGSQLSEAPAFADDPSLFKGQLWAVADTAAQQLIVDESYKSQGAE